MRPTAEQIRALTARWHRVTVWRWLTGRRRPSLRDAIEIRLLTDIPLAYWTDHDLPRVSSSKS